MLKITNFDIPKIENENDKDKADIEAVNNIKNDLGTFSVDLWERLNSDKSYPLSK